MNKFLVFALFSIMTVSAFADLIDDNDVFGMGTKKIILNATTAVALSSSTGVNSSKSDVIYLTFSSENATTAVVGYDNGTSPVAYIPIKEDTSIKVGPFNGNYHVICSTCSDSAGVTVTVDVY